MEGNGNFYMRDWVHRENLEYSNRYIKSQEIIGNEQKNRRKNALVAPAHGTKCFRSPWISSDTFLGGEELFI